MSEIWLDPKTISMVEGEELQLAVEFEGASALADPVSTVFKDGVDYSAETQLAGDADSVSGNVFTLKMITAVEGDAGSRYRVNVQVEVDGTNTEKRLLDILVVKNEQ